MAVANYPVVERPPYLDNNTNRPISDSLIQTAIDTLEAGSSGMASAMYTSFGVRRAYAELLKANRQIVNTMDLQGGYKAISYLGGSHGEIPIISDKDCPANKIFIVDESELSVFRLADFDWMDEDGAILSRVANTDAYEAVLYVYQELGTYMRNAHVLLDDITEQ